MAELERHQIYLLLNQSKPLWLAGIDLSGATLTGANLSGAILSRAFLGGATYNDATVWPDGFDPVAAGAIKVG